MGPLADTPLRGGPARARRLRRRLLPSQRRGAELHPSRQVAAPRASSAIGARRSAAAEIARSAGQRARALRRPDPAGGARRLRGRVRLRQRRSHSQRRVLLVADDRRGDPTQDRHRGAALHRARPGPHLAHRGPASARQIGPAAGGDRRRRVLLVHASYDLVAACAGLPYGLAEAVRLLQEVERPVLVVCGEKFSDKIGTVRTSRMIFGDGAAALVVGPAPAGQPADVEWYQTYASGPMSEVDAIVWPNPAFDNHITVLGPEVRALVGRYLTQMMDELRALPHPDGAPGSLLEAIDLFVPHEANNTMVTELARQAGIEPERLYFNIERVGNTSSASIPIAIRDAVRDGIIDRPMRIFAPGFGAGAVAGYVVMRIDPAIVA